MKVTILISSLLVFLGQFNIVNGGQVALRPRPKNPVLSRSITIDGSMFDPTDEEVFYVVGGEIEQSPFEASYSQIADKIHLLC